MSRRRAALLAALERLPVADQETRRVDVVPIAHPAPNGARGAVVEAMAREAAHGRADLLCFLAPTSRPVEKAWLPRLTRVIGGNVVAATPLLVSPQPRWPGIPGSALRTRELGLGIDVTADGVPVPYAIEARTAAEPCRTPVPVAAASAACVVIDRWAYDAVGGLAPLDDPEAAMFDLCVRLTAEGGSVVAVPNSVVADHRRAGARRGHPIDVTGRGWKQVVEHHGARLRRSGAGVLGPLTFAITVAAPSASLATRWGDWYLAHAMGRALRRLGHPVRVQTADHADDLATRSSDVHLAIRGLSPARRTPGQRHVLWVISHPESIEPRECDEADLVLVASEKFAEHLRTRTSTPVELFLQATDHHRFRPRPASPVHEHPVAVVAKTRDVLRPIVRDSLEVGIEPAIYGTGWEEFVNPAIVVATYVGNDELPVVYSSIGVLLNDHWEDMRSWGFVSNRLFDALACGAPVISDDVPGIQKLFGEAVQTYHEPQELRRLVSAALDDPAGARARAEEGRGRVLGGHTFDHRARSLLELLHRHDLAT